MGNFFKWEITRISVTGRGKTKTNAVEILPAPQLTMGKATLSGKLLDYKHNYQLNLNAYLCELLTGNENEIPIEIKEDGSFCTAIDLCSDQP